MDSEIQAVRRIAARIQKARAIAYGLGILAGAVVTGVFVDHYVTEAGAGGMSAKTAGSAIGWAASAPVVVCVTVAHLIVRQIVKARFGEWVRKEAQATGVRTNLVEELANVFKP